MEWDRAAGANLIMGSFYVLHGAPLRTLWSLGCERPRGHPSSAHSCQMPGHSPALQLPDTIRSLHQEGQRLAAEKDQERLVTVPAAAVKEGELPASAGGGTPGGEAVSQTSGPSEAQGELPARI